VVAMAMGLLLPWIGTVLADGPYLLGPQDKIRLKVHEWRPSIDEIFDWDALNDEYIVSAAGTLSLPFIGELPAAGRSPGDLATLISERLMKEMALGRLPHAAVDVIEHRPFYIVGQVENPGELPHRPSLTVLQAVGMAGGLKRPDGDVLQLERDTISVSGDLHVLGQVRQGLLARRARLEAELTGQQEIEFPEELSASRDDRAIALIMEREELIFDTRRQAYRTQLAALEQLRAHLQQEAQSLEAQLDTERTQLELVRRELDGIKTLAERGLATASRQLGLERVAAQIEGDRLRAETSLLRAHQETSRTEIAILELRNQRSNEIAVDLRDVESQLREGVERLDTAKRLLHRASVSAPSLIRQARFARSRPEYVIVRRIGAESLELPASEDSVVEPGDTIKVELPFDPAVGQLSMPLDPVPYPPEGVSSTLDDMAEGGQLGRRGADWAPR
jgi:protein involved in polysaccharide export with SLBB domain